MAGSPSGETMKACCEEAPLDSSQASRLSMALTSRLISSTRPRTLPSAMPAAIRSLALGHHVQNAAIASGPAIDGSRLKKRMSARVYEPDRACP